MKSVLYAPVFGSVIYAMVTTRLDIAHVVGVINKVTHNPSQSHWNSVKHVFRYLVGTKDHGILFGPNKNLSIVFYTDSNIFRLCGQSKINNRILLQI